MKSINDLNLNVNENLIIQKIKDAIQGTLPDSTIILFGSRARGDASVDSDWDLLVLTDTVNWIIEHKAYQALYEVELEQNVIFNVHVIARDDWEHKRYAGHPMKRNVDNEGVMVA